MQPEIIQNFWRSSHLVLCEDGSLVEESEEYSMTQSSNNVENIFDSVADREEEQDAHESMSVDSEVIFQTHSNVTKVAFQI